MLEEIKLYNYKSCKKIKLPLKQPLMVLIGKNSAGKTNTLKGIYTACILAFSGKLHKEHGLEIQKGFGAQFIFRIRGIKCEYSFGYYRKKFSFIKDTLSVIDNDKKIKIFKKSNETKLKIHGFKSYLTIPPETTALNIIKELLVKDEKPDYIKEILLYKNIIAGILLDMSRVKFCPLNNPIEPALFLLDDFNQWKKTRNYNNENMLFSFKLYDLFKNETQTFNEFKNILIKLNLIEDIELSEVKMGEDYKLNIWRFLHYGKPVPFSWLSHGSKRIIILTLELFYGKTSLLLIQEPENSIHWGLFVKILALLTRYAQNKKILFSTYSEQIIRHLNSEQFIHLQNKGGITKVKNINNERLKKFLIEEKTPNMAKKGIIRIGYRAKRLIGL